MAWTKTSEALAKLPQLLLRRQLAFDFDGIPLFAEKLTLRKIMNLLGVGMENIFESNYRYSFPPILQIEPTNLCNLKCPLCVTGDNLLQRPKGMMAFSTFQQILDELAHVLLAVYLYGFGEPFMHPDLARMIHACTERNILTLTSTNGHFLQSLEEALQIVDAGLSVLIIAVDGSTQAIYESYRLGGNLAKVKRCIANIERAKAQRGSHTPYTVIRSVVMHENEDDLAHIEQLARDSGVNMFSVKTVGCLPQSERYAQYEPDNVRLRRFDPSVNTPVRRRCPFPFRQPTVFWDGTVVGCEFDHACEQGFGRIGEHPFAALWNSPTAVSLRRNIRNRQEHVQFCRACPYRNRSQEGVELLCKEFKGMSR